MREIQQRQLCSTGQKFDHYPILRHLWTSHKRWSVPGSTTGVSRVPANTPALQSPQASAFPRNSRYVPILHESHQGAWFSFPGKTEEWHTLGEHGHVFTSGPSPENPQTRLSCQCTMCLFYHSQAKTEMAETSMKGYECPCFQKLCKAPLNS